MRPGDIVAGRFELQLLAGEGGMGEVWRALDLTSGKPVAVKVLHEDYVDPAERFKREAEVLADLRHPAIVRHVDHGVSETGALYLAMEWLSGEDLSKRLQRERLTVSETMTLLARVADALAAVHACGVTHRDLKPSNLFLVERDVARTKLLDFGIASLTMGARMTRTGVLLGTPGYMAPEQAQSNRRVDARADVFALGCVLYECLTGEPAFTGEQPVAVLAKLLIDEVPRARERCPDVPPSLDALCAWMLIKDPDQRPSDGTALATAVSAIGRSSTLPKGTGEAPSSELPTQITSARRRLLSLVLVGPVEHPVPRGDAVTTTGDTVTMDINGGYLSLSEELLQEVEALNGHVDSMMDGSLLVTVMGTGLANDQAAQAARCALKLRAHLKNRPISLATGRSEVAGRLPAGDLIDRAVEMLIKRSQRPPSDAIAIDEVTAGLLDARFEVTEDESLLWLSSEHALAAGAKTLLGKPTACVGRDIEIATLAAIFAECVEEPRAHAVIVTAPAGIGKTRLAHEFLRRTRASEPPMDLWIGRGDPLRVGAAFGLLGQALQRVSGIQDGEPLPARRDKLLARVARAVGKDDARRVAEFLGELLGTPFPDEESVLLRAARMDAQLMGDQMRRAFLDFLGAACDEAPVLLLLEDLHWGDLPTVMFINEALRQLKDKPLMVLCLARPEVYDLFPKLWADRDVQRVYLNALTPRASARLVQQVLGERISAERLTRLVMRADGNAFYLEELIRAFAEETREALPETVVAMVQSRLESLDPGLQRILRAASVFGEELWRGGLLSLLGGEKEVPELDDDLTRLEQKEWLTSRPTARFQGERELCFRHALLREAAYGMLTADDRALGHRLAGAWLEQASEPSAAVIAEHFDRGNDPEAAARSYHRAAAQALAGHDLAAVLTATERALALGAQGELRGEVARLRAEAFGWQRDLSGAMKWAREAMATLPRGSASWYSALYFAGLAAGQLGQRARLASLTDELSSAWSNEETIGAAMVTSAGMVLQLFYAGLHARAEALHSWLAEGAPLFEDDPEVSGYVFLARWTRAMFTGSVSQLKKLAEGALECFERIGSVGAASVARMFLGSSELQLGAIDEAVAQNRALIVACEQMGIAFVLAYAQSYLGRALAILGSLEEARAVELSAAAAFEAQGDRAAEGLSRAYLADILRRSGALGEAEAEARRATSLLDVEHMPWQVVARATLAEVLLARRQPAEALAEARAAVALVASLGGRSVGEALARIVFVETLAAVGEGREAKAALAEARDRLLAVGAAIDDPSQRESFQRSVPENARTLELAQRWLGDPAAGAL